MPTLPIRTHLIVALEIAASLASLVLAAFWIQEPSGPYEPYLVAAGFAFAATEAFRRYEGKLFRTEGVERTPAERVRHHESWRGQFKEEIYRCRAEKLRKDVIIRHVNRLDSYPDAKEGPGISPWFKVGLLETYHMGIRVGLQWHGLVRGPEGLRRSDYKNNEKSEFNALLMGEIPYDFIESMNVQGDEYYHFPHIFCHFAHRGEPYQRLFYAQEVDMGNGHSYWKQIASYEEVERNGRAKAA
jgi:hypothetical protein